MKRNNLYASLTLLILLAAVVAVVSVYRQNQSQHEKQLGTVYQICKLTQEGRWTVPLKTCGMVEDEYSAEFLCDANNTDPATHCWVEAK